MNWRIGCSGFYYPEWKEVFYPKGVPSGKWFEYYCQHFNTVELNGTFYRTPQISQLRNWYNKSPENFKFSVKAPRLITHYKKFSKVGEEVHQFYTLVTAGLADKASCILFQLPPSFAFSEQNLVNIVQALNPEYNNVIEFRHATWWQSRVYETLQQNAITFCSISYPSLPNTVVKTKDILYYRFHGVPELYKSAYSPEALSAVMVDVRSKQAKDNYVYFNNTMFGTAIANIRDFRSLLKDPSETEPILLRKS